jgi:hypothetical protein
LNSYNWSYRPAKVVLLDVFGKLNKSTTTFLLSSRHDFICTQVKQTNHSDMFRGHAEHDRAFVNFITPKLSGLYHEKLTQARL